MPTYFASPRILQCPPIKRAAYSDRTAWILAEVCRLVYEPLPVERDTGALVQEIREAVQGGIDDDALAALVRRARERGREDASPIEPALRESGFQLLDGFAIDGTEGVIIRLDATDTFEGMLVVAFRGTQPSVSDIVTDIQANLVAARDGGRIHAGFQEAFDRVGERIREALAEHQGLPVYFTGHSLGGALALVATRYLGSDGAGATYTFGCPRVADDAFFYTVKTPVYRIVHGADAVARIPFGYGLNFVLAGLRVIPINGTFQISEWIRKRFVGYTHFGDLVFLRPGPVDTNTSGTPAPAARLIKRSPNIFWRVKTTLLRWIATRCRAGASDHSMEQYALKLRAYAEWRNPEQQR